MFRAPNFKLPASSWRTRLWHGCWLLLLSCLLISCWSLQPLYDGVVVMVSIAVIGWELVKLRRQRLNIVSICHPGLEPGSSRKLDRSRPGSSPGQGFVAGMTDWQLIDTAGNSFIASLQGSTRVTPWLIYLSFKVNSGSSQRCRFGVLLWRRELPAPTWRHLSAYLRYTNG